MVTILHHQRTLLVHLVKVWVRVLKLAHAFHNYDRGANLFHCITECDAIMREIMVQNERTSNYYPFPSKTFALQYLLVHSPGRIVSYRNGIQKLIIILYTW